MHADFAVLAGTHHSAAALPCQDYCLAGTESGRAWGVVADGCSTGGLTDIGARAWALGAFRLLASSTLNLRDAGAVEAAVTAAATPILEQLRPEDGYATLGLIHADDATLEVLLFGDGVLILKHLDGAVTFFNVQYSDNAPFYLNYRRYPELCAQWNHAYGGQERVVVVHKLDAQGELMELRTERASARTPAFALSIPLANNDIQVAMLATDGATTCGEGLFSAICELAAFKSSAGEFLKRRVARLMRDWQKTGQQPTDDLAVVGLWLEKDPSHG